MASGPKFEREQAEKRAEKLRKKLAAMPEPFRLEWVALGGEAMTPANKVGFDKKYTAAKDLARKNARTAAGYTQPSRGGKSIGDKYDNFTPPTQTFDALRVAEWRRTQNAVVETGKLEGMAEDEREEYHAAKTMKQEEKERLMKKSPAERDAHFQDRNRASASSRGRGAF